MGVVTPDILYLPAHHQHWYLHNTDMECIGLKIIATEHFHQNMVGIKNLTSLTVKCNKRYKKIINLSFYQCFNLFPASLSLNVSKIWADGFKLINIIEVSYLHNHLSTGNNYWTNIESNQVHALIHPSHQRTSLHLWWYTKISNMPIS